MNNKLITVLTVAYNSEKTIKDTIESVLNQTYNIVEYIIIDGASQDRTVEIAESYRNRFEEKGYKYQIISEPDDGMYDAINKGIRMASGVVIGSINSDDWYEKDTLAEVMRCYEEEKFDMLYGNLRIYTPKVTKIKKARLRKFVTSRDWNHPTTFITKETYGRFCYKQDTMYDDFDLFTRIRKNNCKVVIVNKILANFRFGGMSTKRSLKEMLKRVRIRYRIYRNNGYGRLYGIECVFTELAKFLIS